MFVQECVANTEICSVKSFPRLLSNGLVDGGRKCQKATEWKHPEGEAWTHHPRLIHSNDLSNVFKVVDILINRNFSAYFKLFGKTLRLKIFPRSCIFSRSVLSSPMQSAGLCRKFLILIRTVQLVRCVLSAST